MKWNFFYDENHNKPYESIQDWHLDIKYLILPAIVMVVLGVDVYFYFQFFHF